MRHRYLLYPAVFSALCTLGCDDDVENPPHRPDGGPIPTQTVIHKVESLVKTPAVIDESETT